MASDWGFVNATAGIGTVTDSGGTVVGANASRKYLILRNTGGTAAYFACGGVPALNQGVRVNGLGTPPCEWELDRGKGNVYTGAITGLLAVAGTALFSYLEGT